MIMNKLEKMLLFLSIITIFIFNYASGFANLITNLLIIVFIAFEFIVCIKNKKLNFNKNIIYYILFVCLCTVSIVYSYDYLETFTKVKTLIILLLYLFSIFNYSRNEENIMWLIKSIVISSIFSSIYVLMNFNGTRVNDIIGDSNQVAAYLAYSIPLIIMMLKKKKINKYFGVMGLLIILLANVLSGSRSGLLVTIIGFIVCYFDKEKLTKRKLLKFFITSTLFVCLLYFAVSLIMNNPVLYKVIGSRYVSFFEIITGGTSSIKEQSTITRQLMLGLAWNKFIQSPFTIFFGNGIGFFASYFETFSFGWHAFCHNNYLELLSGVGMIGFLLYYIPYFKEFILAIKNKNNNIIYKCKYAIFIQMFLMHFFVVFYYQKCEIIFLAFLLSELSNKRNGGELND